MADDTERADFVRLNYCFQTQLDSMWYGSIAVDDVLKWKVSFNKSCRTVSNSLLMSVSFEILKQLL